VGAITAVVTIFSIMLSDFFDTMGTVVGIGTSAPLPGGADDAVATNRADAVRGSST